MPIIGVCAEYQQFFDPIILSGRKPLLTLRDAAQFVMKFPKAEHDAEEWQAAMAALLLVAEHDGPTMFPRISVMRAINGGTSTRAARSSGPRKKAARKYRIVR